MLFIFAPLYLVYPRVNQNAPKHHLWGIDKLQAREAVGLKRLLCQTELSSSNLIMARCAPAAQERDPPL